MGYFNASAEYSKQQKFNEASFLFYTGYFRYKYFNASKPNYKASGDGALVGSLSTILGEPINMYLRCNIENYISILTLTIQYRHANDYACYSKEKDLEKYNLQIKKALDLVDDLKTNKDKDTKEWKK